MKAVFEREDKVRLRLALHEIQDVNLAVPLAKLAFGHWNHLREEKELTQKIIKLSTHPADQKILNDFINAIFVQNPHLVYFALSFRTPENILIMIDISIMFTQPNWEIEDIIDGEDLGNEGKLSAGLSENGDFCCGMHLGRLNYNLMENLMLATNSPELLKLPQETAIYAPAWLHSISFTNIDYLTFRMSFDS